MTPSILAPKALARLVFRRNLSRQRQIRNNSDYKQIRYLRSTAAISVLSLADKMGGYTSCNFPECGSSSSTCSSMNFQKRKFLGCSDSGDGNMLAKVYEERRVLGYSPEQLFDVVAAVDLYGDFVPWCQRSEIMCHNPDGSFDAELEIGFKFLVESYVSHVELNKPKSIKTTSSQNSIFDHLINIWEFNPGPVPGTCDLYFLVDFKFQSPFYRQIANMFFKEVVSRLVASFNERCRLIYGPGVPVLEKNL
ncbi:hypothetical protein OROGR_032953 [Orobanche gracilis]